jgi:hypothetical protein
VRLIHSEGDDLSGLIVDRYDDLFVVEIANYGLEQIKDVIVDALQAKRIYFKNDIPARKLEHLSVEAAGRSGPASPFARTDCSFSSSRHRDRRPASFSISARIGRWRARWRAAVAC